MPPAPDQSWDPALYQSAHAFVWQKASDLLDLLAPRAGERILDLGCGTGQLTAKIADNGAEVLGIDRSPEMVDQARRNFPHLAFEVGDATTFVADRPFDAVFSNATLHWVKPPEAAVRCVHAALRPGGRFVAEFGGRGNVRRRVRCASRGAPGRGGGGLRPAEPVVLPGRRRVRVAAGATRAGSDGAALFERPTPLAGGEAGLRDWVRMFGATFLNAIGPERHEALFASVEAHARAALYRDGNWTADYRRLRIVATRVG
jgi:trans-aconitate 2-methyltransferase